MLDVNNVDTFINAGVESYDYTKAQLYLKMQAVLGCVGKKWRQY